jgi:signal transduction histidine kinase
MISRSFARPTRGKVRSATVTPVRSLIGKAWTLAQRYWFDALLLVGLGLGLAIVVHDQNTKDGPQGPLWFDVLSVVAVIAPFFLRKRFPFGAPASVAIVIALSSFVDNRVIPSSIIMLLAGIAANVLFAMLPERRKALAGYALTLGVAVVVARTDPQGSFGDWAWPAILFTIAWIIGWAVGGQFRQAEEARGRAQRAEREREEQARLAVGEERARIARELHDVVGHSVSVMTVQASAVRRLLKPEQEREREALLIVEQTGREAMAEMRRMVGVLRRPEEAPALAPQPSLEHLDKLIEQARESGLPVTLKVEGDAVQLPAGVDLTAYRLVQEGLTNALKHARAQNAEVLVRYSNGFVELTVTDDGSGDGGGDSGGHGLVGMRERVSVYGGDLQAGPRPEGGFRLRATLPVGGA